MPSSPRRFRIIFRADRAVRPYTRSDVPCERPLPLPLGEVAERSEDGEGKQRRATSLCEAAQCSPRSKYPWGAHWVVRRSVAEVSRPSAVTEGL